jgi:hypothetical protein
MAGARKTGCYGAYIASLGGAHIGIDVWQRTQRGCVRPPGAQPAAIRNAHAFTFVVRCALWSCDAVLDGGVGSVEFIAPFAGRTVEFHIVAASCHSVRHSSLGNRVFSGWTCAHQQPNRQMDPTVTAPRLAIAGTSLGSVSLVQNRRAHHRVRGAGFLRCRSLTANRAVDVEAVDFNRPKSRRRRPN